MPDIREAAKIMTMYTAEMLVKDADYVPDEMLDWSPMDYGKSVLTILYECASANTLIAAAISGAQEHKKYKKTDLATLQKDVLESAQTVCDAIDSLSDADMEGDIQMPWGAIMPASIAIMLPDSHMSYHDGQINYIQTLLGDTKFHWLEKD